MSNFKTLEDQVKINPTYAYKSIDDPNAEFFTVKVVELNEKLNMVTFLSRGDDFTMTVDGFLNNFLWDGNL